MNPTPIEIIATAIFGIAIAHTFSVSFFEKLSKTHPQHAGLFHLLGEVEVVFGFWALVLVLMLSILQTSKDAVHFVEDQNYTEALFVFAVMVVAASKPILTFANTGINGAAQLVSRFTPIPVNTVIFFLSLSVVPLMGSLITEPAAMTLAALLLRDRFYKVGLPIKFQYAIIGVLFVNISIGGTLTNFAAPPVLMVAAAWEWSTPFMFTHFGDRAALAVFVNALLITIIFRKHIPIEFKESPAESMPITVIFVHLLFLAAVVVFAHYPAVFLWLFLFFLGFTNAYSKYQNPLILREALLVAFFLAGLVVLGSLQKWWLQPVLESMTPTVAFYGTAALTALTDNAALTYLGSLVEGTSQEFRVALVAGAVTGGGLTVIANAPNPAGISILREYFNGKVVNPTYLFLAALAPTLVAVIAFRFI
ncbi:putative Na+/H+ antiporter [Polynucleobacter rarus]|uniref:putative Na+/H+ antiporter n=1 Tax=Polynucleobacter rarus TaxID=556055 RepID=UPI000D3E8E21|nr:putative Na+/H+ antiporter [Polynucleobacter rarus]